MRKFTKIAKIDLKIQNEKVFLRQKHKIAAKAMN